MERRYFKSQTNFEKRIVELNAVKCTVYCDCGATIGARVHDALGVLQMELVFCGKCYKNAPERERGE